MNDCVLNTKEQQFTFTTWLRLIKFHNSWSITIIDLSSVFFKMTSIRIWMWWFKKEKIGIWMKRFIMIRYGISESFYRQFQHFIQWLSTHLVKINIISFYTWIIFKCLILYLLMFFRSVQVICQNSWHFYQRSEQEKLIFNLVIQSHPNYFKLCANRISLTWIIDFKLSLDIHIHKYFLIILWSINSIEEKMAELMIIHQQ
jgi:hypothetical protein